MHRFRHLALALAATGTALIGGGSLTAGAATGVPPHVVAKPDNVMVNTRTTIVGTGFAPLATVTVAECSQTEWLVPQNPCADNEFTVHTTAAGAFKHKLIAELCPQVIAEGVSEVCHVGVLAPTGLDELTLIGASDLTVTGP